MAKWNKKRVKKQFAWTSKCFKQALIDVYGHLLTKDQKRLGTEALCKLLLFELRQQIHNQETNQAYLSPKKTTHQQDQPHHRSVRKG